MRNLKLFPLCALCILCGFSSQSKIHNPKSKNLLVSFVLFMVISPSAISVFSAVCPPLSP